MKACRRASSALARQLGASTPPALTGRLSGHVHRLYGLEIFPGVGTPLSRTTRYGATFVAVERGRMSVTLIGWVNYTPIFFKPDTVCRVVGGRWWLLAATGPRCRGLLHGSFRDGTVRWNGDAKLADASMEMEVWYGRNSGGEHRVSAKLVAGLNHLPFPPRIGGMLSFDGPGEER